MKSSHAPRTALIKLTNALWRECWVMPPSKRQRVPHAKKLRALGNTARRRSLKRQSLGPNSSRSQIAGELEKATSSRLREGSPTCGASQIDDTVSDFSRSSVVESACEGRTANINGPIGHRSGRTQ